MSRQIIHYDGYHVCTDGSLKPAMVLVTNYLIREYWEVALGILEKHGMKGTADYIRKNEDDYNAVILVVRPDAYDKIRETLVDLAEVSKEIQMRDDAEEERKDKIRSDAMVEFERVFAEIDKLIGEDVG